MADRAGLWRWLLAFVLLAGLAVLNVSCGGGDVSGDDVGEEASASGGAGAVEPSPVPEPTPEPEPDPAIVILQQTITALSTTPTPVPVAVVLPTRTPIPTATLRPTPTATALPQPTPWALAPPTPEPAGPFLGVYGRLALSVDPGSPFTGQDVHFEMSGLEPYAVVSVSFVGPDGAAWYWVDRGDILSRRVSGDFYADRDGVARWLWRGTPALSGDWKLRVRTGEERIDLPYDVRDMVLDGLDRRTVGRLLFHGYNGFAAPVYFANGVPSYFAPALQGRLDALNKLLKKRLGPVSRYEPDVHLVGSISDLGVLISDLGYPADSWEQGLYAEGERPAVYALGSGLFSDVEERVSHQYVDGYVGRIVGGVALPAWLDEGVASYFAAEAGLQSVYFEPSLHRLLRDADLVKDEVESGALPPLARLGPRDRWSRRYEQADVARQYRYSHMMVRYFAERFGLGSLRELLDALGGGATVEEAVLEVTAFGYGRLEEGFSVWMAAWDHPVRRDSAGHLDFLDELKVLDLELDDRRALALRDWELDGDRSVAVRDWEDLVARVTEMERRMELADDVPAFLQEVHGTVARYLELQGNFLGLELEARRGEFGRESALDEAQALVPEMEAYLRDWETMDREVRRILVLAD